jgi:hypothetical protein
MAAGVLGLLGVRHLESRRATIIVAIGALLNGAVVIRYALKGGRPAT